MCFMAMLPSPGGKAWTTNETLQAVQRQTALWEITPLFSRALIHSEISTQMKVCCTVEKSCPISLYCSSKEPATWRSFSTQVPLLAF